MPWDTWAKWWGPRARHRLAPPPDAARDAVARARAPPPDLPQRRNAPAAAHALQGIRRCGSGGGSSPRVPRQPQRRHAATPLSLAGMGVAALRRFRAGAGPCGRRARGHRRRGRPAGGAGGCSQTGAWLAVTLTNGIDVGGQAIFAVSPCRSTSCGGEDVQIKLATN